eukprot:scaffold5327_cov44-Attheya_sp.AAC.1
MRRCSRVDALELIPILNVLPLVLRNTRDWRELDDCPTHSRLEACTAGTTNHCRPVACSLSSDSSATGSLSS